MVRESDRSDLYVLQPLQPRILLSACLVNQAAADSTDNTPAIDVGQDDQAAAPADDNSDFVATDAVFSIREAVQPADDGAADDKSSDVSADPAADSTDANIADDASGDVKPTGILYVPTLRPTFTIFDAQGDDASTDAGDQAPADDSGDMAPTGILYMGGAGGGPDVLFPLKPDAGDQNAAADNGDGANVFFPLNDDAGVPAPATDDAGGANVLFPLNPDANDPASDMAATDLFIATDIEVPVIATDVAIPVVATDVAIPVAAKAPVPTSDAPASAAPLAPAAPQATGTPAANPLLSHQDDLLGAKSELLG